MADDADKRMFDPQVVTQPATKADLISVTIQTAAALAQINLALAALESGQLHHVPAAREKIEHCMNKLLETFEKLRGATNG